MNLDYCFSYAWIPNEDHPGKVSSSKNFFLEVQTAKTAPYQIYYSSKDDVLPQKGQQTEQNQPFDLWMIFITGWACDVASVDKEIGQNLPHQVWL